MYWKSGLMIMAGVALCALVGCGDGEDDLSKEAVTSIGPGNAKGTGYTGSYKVTLTTTSCSGTCPIIVIFSVCSEGAKDTETASVTHKDGALTMKSSGLMVNEVSGGINGDGSFKLGGAGTMGGGTVSVTGLVNGTIDKAGKVTGTARARGVGSVKVGSDTVSVNCTGTYKLEGYRK